MNRLIRVIARRVRISNCGRQRRSTRIANRSVFPKSASCIAGISTISHIGIEIPRQKNILPAEKKTMSATLCCAVEQVDQQPAAEDEDAYRQLLAYVPTFQLSRTTQIAKSWTIAPQYALIRVWPRHWARVRDALFPADRADPSGLDSVPDESGALMRNGVLRRPVLCRFTSTYIHLQRIEHTLIEFHGQI